MTGLQMQRQILDLQRQVERISTWDSPGQGGGKQYATFVVAASDTTAAGKANADYVCDGTADEVEINNAFSETTPSTYRRVLLLEGTYTTAATITMVANSVLEGQNDATNVICGANGIFAVTAASNTTIASLKLDRGSSTSTGGIGASGVTDLKVIDCEFIDWPSGALYIYTASSNVYVNNCRFDGNNTTGIYADASDYLQVTECHFSDCDNGIWLDGSDYGEVVGNYFYDCNFGVLSTGDKSNISSNSIRLSSSSGVQVSSSQGHTITGNNCYACDEGIVLDTVTMSTVSGNTCTGHLSNNGSFGIDAGNSDYCVISGNQCSEHSNSGIYLNSSDHNLVTGNVCVGNSWSSSTNYGLNDTHGILIQSSDNNYIHGNLSRKTSPGSSFFQRNGIRIDNSASDDNYVIDNDLRDGGNEADFADAGTNTIYRTPIGELLTTSLTIATGAVTINSAGYYTVLPESGTTDDLDTINGGADGQTITIRAQDSGDTITAKDGTGNLNLAGDFAMNAQQDTLQLIYDATLAEWLELARSNNA